MAKVVVDAKELSNAITLFGRVTQSSANSPVYKCLLFEVKGKRLIIRGTDQAIFVEKVLTLKNAADEPFSFLVPFSAMDRYVRAAGGTVTLVKVKNELKMSTKFDHATAKLRGVDDYMTWPTWDKMSPVHVNVDNLLYGIKVALPCVSSNLVKPILYNVSLKARKGQLVIQSADGTKFQRTTLPAPKTSIDVLVSLNAASRLITSINGAEDVGVNQSMLGLKSRTQIVYVVLSEGAPEYPNLGKLVSSSRQLTVILDRKALLRTIQRAIGFSSDETVMDVRLTFAGDELSVRASSKELGAYGATLKIKKRVGKDYSVFLHGGNLVGFLQRIDNDNVIIHFSPIDDPSAHGQIRIVNPDEPEDLYCMYPILKDRK